MSEDSGEDSPLRPKRKIKKVLILSGSSSDSDESISQLRTRNKRLRVVSEDERSDSSDSSVVAPVARRRRTIPQLRESASESDTSHSSTERTTAVSTTALAASLVSGFSSDSSEGNSDKCSICLMRFTNQEVGTPQNCDHVFCLDCITEWSKNVNTCPVDRSTFEVIVVRKHFGGREIRHEHVHSQERSPSIEVSTRDDSTFCEICGSSEDEATMLLCDSCDLGFHMQCLTPPLQEIPAYEWYCPTCSEDHLDGLIELAEIQDLIDDSQDIERPLGPRPSALRVAASSNRGRPGRRRRLPDQPSTSSSRVRTAPANSATRARPRRRYKRRRKTHTVIIEYELEGDGKFPIKKTVAVKRRLRRRVLRKRTRTAARRSHVRASVRAQLAAQGGAVEVTGAGTSVRDLAVRRQRAGVPALRLFGDPDQLDYFSDDDAPGPGGLAVGVRAAPTALTAYRQARRKALTIPSPPPASTVPDLLSNILESQALLHSKNTVVSIGADGRLDIELRNHGTPPHPDKNSSRRTENGTLDLSNSEDLSRKAPSYPGQSRGGGWGGGYRGQRPRDSSAGCGTYGGHQGRPPHSYRTPSGSAGGWRDDSDSPNNYMRRTNQYTDYDPHGDRDNVNRRQNLPPPNRGHGHFPPRFLDRGRSSLGPSWHSDSGDSRGPRVRHSFGGFDDPLDMRMAQSAPPQSDVDLYGDIDPPRHESAAQPTYDPLPEPPIFTFDNPPEVDKSEDERSDSGLVIDTDKYDPTDPTRDDSSGDEQKAATAGSRPPEPPQGPASMQDTEFGITDAGALGVTPTALNKAVQQALQEHSSWTTPNEKAQQDDKSDGDSEGDCPNFSIYSATSVHIANNSANIISIPSAHQSEEPAYPPDEDLVQEDDDTPTRDETSNASITMANDINSPEPQELQLPTVTAEVFPSLKKIEIDYNEKVSKRCPITPNPRTPIKIKLNTPTLIKRQMIDLYDDDDIDVDDNTAVVPLRNDTRPQTEEKSTIKKNSPVTQSENTVDSLQDLEINIQEMLTENKKISEHTQEKEDALHSPCKQNDSGAKNSVTHEDKLYDNSCEVNDTNNDIDCEKNSDHEIDNEGIGNDYMSDTEIDVNVASTTEQVEAQDDMLEKMTESISETEDERSYTPCLDENKSKDASVDIEKDSRGIEGLDTELISDEEGNGIFSDNEKNTTDKAVELGNIVTPALDAEEGEISEKRSRQPSVTVADEGKKKKRKESKKESKDKTKNKSKKSDVAFKKLSKSGKERNYRDKDKKDKEDKSKNKKERQKSTEREKEKVRRKEKRKDLERYDVRTVVSEKRRKFKDPFGRDVSPRARSGSPSETRSGNASPAPPFRRSPSSPARRLRSSPSASPCASPDIVRRRSERSTSRKRRRTPSPRLRRSPSRTRRLKRSMSPRRRSLSPRRRRSISRSRKRARRDVSHSPKPKSRKKKRSRSERRTTSRAGSFTGKEKKSRRNKRKSRTPRKKSPKQKRVKLRSLTPELELSPERRRSIEEVPVVTPWADKSPLYRGWSRSLSRSVNSRLLSPGWTPPRNLSPEPRRLRVILANDDALRTKERRRRQRDLDKHRHPKHGREAGGPSKEVFTSGDNILVSVSFNKKDQGDGAPPVDLPGKHRKRKNDTKKDRREKKRKKGPTGPDASNAKPVAIIDLDRSPFRELTPSPKNVIVLSDSDHGDKEDPELPAPVGDVPAADRPVEPARPTSPPAGPKTPPEPAVKFSIAPKPAVQLRPVNPLREHEEPREDHARDKGPNTPPEPPDSPPSSADAYDPFEPTRSRSASPAPAARPPTTITLETAQKTNLSADDVVNQRPISPMEKVMALLQSTRDVSPTDIDELNRAQPATAPPDPMPANSNASTTTAAPPAAAVAPTTQSPVGAATQSVYLNVTIPRVGVFGGAPSPQRSGVGQRIVLPSPTKSSPIRPQPPKLFLAKPSPIKSNPIKPLQSTKISKLPLPTMKAVGALRKQPEDEVGPGLDSPYSPGSSDFGDLFEPPADAAAHAAKPYSKPTKGDLFDSLLGGKAKLSKSKSSATKVPVKQIKKKGKTQVGVKIDEDNLKILDDLPSSAVEMQVKSKFLKKLNRQERVVEEVKLVLKPHYYKKRVTKEEYKDILRRAVPKICHNKSGEINPSKIQALVEAYVRKFRKRHKLGLA